MYVFVGIRASLITCYNVQINDVVRPGQCKLLEQHETNMTSEFEAEYSVTIEGAVLVHFKEAIPFLGQPELKRTWPIHVHKLLEVAKVNS